MARFILYRFGLVWDGMGIGYGVCLRACVRACGQGSVVDVMHDA